MGFFPLNSCTSLHALRYDPIEGQPKKENRSDPSGKSKLSQNVFVSSPSMFFLSHLTHFCLTTTVISCPHRSRTTCSHSRGIVNNMCVECHHFVPQVHVRTFSVAQGRYGKRGKEGRREIDIERKGEEASGGSQE